MERTISGMMGKGSVNHNTRAFSAKNVDKERSRDNVEFCHEDIKAVYHELFDEALERYNAKQKRSDRKIENYYEKIRQGKQEKLFYEVIFQIGNRDDMNARSEEGQLAKQILIDFMTDFQSRNPNLHVFSAHLHMDEETPHIHIDFVPVITGSKRGLDTRVSLKGALAEQGFEGGTRGATEWNQWIESEKKELAAVMERYGVEWLQKGTHNKHLSVLDYEKQERVRPTHERLLKAERSLLKLIKENTLFTYLDKEFVNDFIAPSTNNRIEGGINSRLREMLRNHRGLSIERRIKAVYWWCYMHSPEPLALSEIIKTMPTDRSIAAIYQRMNDKAKLEKSLSLWGDAIVWSDLHKMDKSFSEWD